MCTVVNSYVFNTEVQHALAPSRSCDVRMTACLIKVPMSQTFDLEINFDFLTLNVRCLRDSSKHQKIFDYLKKHTSPYSTFFLQEVHSLKQDKNVWSAQFRGLLKYSHGTNDSKGIIIGFRESLEITIDNEYRDNEGRYPVLCTVQGHPVLLINFYNANDKTNKVGVLNGLSKLLQNTYMDPHYRIVFGGDMDVVFDLRFDSDRGSPALKTRTLSHLELLLHTYDLTDIWSFRNLRAKRFTFRQKSLLIQRRLDHIFVSSDLQDSVTTTDIIPSVCTDHSAVYLKFQTLKEHSSLITHCLVMKHS